MGATLQKLGRFEDAEASHNQAIALNSSHVEAHSNLGATLQMLGKLEKAQISYEIAISLKPDWAEAYRIVASMKTYDEQYAKMFELYRNGNISNVTWTIVIIAF